jgi:ATP-dependent Clp protease ATP-binding subunit ClpA
VIGATTDDEYNRWVCGDPALERRFQKVAVRELSAEDTLDILRARKERLERHHNVMITEEAILAAVQLTDAHPADRHRPDRAIDVLDEACAHTHALAVYSAATEAMILERREFLRRKAAPPESQSAGSNPEPRSSSDDMTPDDDTLDRFARGSAAALERFGAELEAMFVGVPAEGGDRGEAPASPQPEVKRSNGMRASEGMRLAELEAELGRRLLEEGVVVRGTDIARVVAVATGGRVTWPQ